MNQNWCGCLQRSGREQDLPNICLAPVTYNTPSSSQHTLPLPLFWTLTWFPVTSLSCPSDELHSKYTFLSVYSVFHRCQICLPPILHIKSHCPRWTSEGSERLSTFLCACVRSIKARSPQRPISFKCLVFSSGYSSVLTPTCNDLSSTWIPRYLKSGM